MGSRRHLNHTLTALFGPIALVLGAWLVLHPGLSGAFLLDDMPNLGILDKVSLTDWSEHSLVQYLGSKSSSATGRPVAMLSFLPHAHHWPSNPAPFLWSNLLIHCAVALLLLGLTRRIALLSQFPDDATATRFALFVALLWLVHPLHVSTVFYTVQRMAQLSALFSIASIYAYVAGRTALDQGHNTRALSLLAVTPLLAITGAYSKENAALVPVGLLLVEYWFFGRSPHNSRVIAAVRTTFLWIPSALILAYILYRAHPAGYAARDFTALERVLTQCRILFDYVHLIIVPKQITGGLFNDAYPISRDLLTPITTLPAVLGCIAIPIIAFLCRQRAPLLTWGVLFFFGMHLAESSTLPLELYYEHRNYLPSFGLVLAITAVVVRLFRYRRYLGVAAAAVLLGSSASVAHVRADNWGHPYRQAEIWTRVEPNSPRAWQNLALREDKIGNVQGVLTALSNWRRLKPDSVLPMLSMLIYRCPQEAVTAARWRRLRDLAQQGEIANGLVQAVRKLANATLEGRCRVMRPDQVHVLVRDVLSNPNLNDDSVRQQLWHVDGQLLLAPGFVSDAMDAFRRSHRQINDPQFFMAQAQHLADRGCHEEALDVLSWAKEAPERTKYGPLHVFWLLYEPGQLDEIAQNIRMQGSDACSGATANSPLRHAGG